jgi:hypothetical protein
VVLPLPLLPPLLQLPLLVLLPRRMPGLQVPQQPAPLLPPLPAPLLPELQQQAQQQQGQQQLARALLLPAPPLPALLLPALLLLALPLPALLLPAPALRRQPRQLVLPLLASLPLAASDAQLVPRLQVLAPLLQQLLALRPPPLLVQVRVRVPRRQAQPSPLLLLALAMLRVRLAQAAAHSWRCSWLVLLGHWPLLWLGPPWVVRVLAPPRLLWLPSLLLSPQLPGPLLLRWRRRRPLAWRHLLRHLLRHRRLR